MARSSTGTGLFFVFEGIDGVGKTTQRELFVEWLEGLGHDVVTCRDPGETPLGESLREILLHRKSLAIEPRAEIFLYMASRAQLVSEIIKPARTSGRTVVSDRFHLSTLAYQAHARGIDIEQVRAIGLFAAQECLPDLVLLLDMDAAEAARRRHGPADRIESRGSSYLEQVRRGFLAEAEREPDRVAVIDAAGDIETVQAAIRRAAQRVLETA